MFPHKLINFTHLIHSSPPHTTHTHMQWRCMIVVIWPVDVQNVLRPEWGQSSHVDGVGVVVRWYKSAPLIVSLLRGKIVLPPSSTHSFQCLVRIQEYCHYHWWSQYNYTCKHIECTVHVVYYSEKVYPYYFVNWSMLPIKYTVEPYYVAQWVHGQIKAFQYASNISVGHPKSHPPPYTA